MNITNKFELSGSVRIRHFDSLGQLKSEELLNNLIVNTGKAVVAGLINGVITKYFSYIALGTDATAAAATQTALLAEITTNGGQRTAVSPSRTTTTVTNDTMRMVASWVFTGPLTIQELGIFDSASSGIMLSRVVPTPKTVSSGETLQITWDIKAS